MVNENIHLKERIDELAANERCLIELNKKLQAKLEEHEYPSKRSDSSSSNSSSETVITTTSHTRRIQDLGRQIEILKSDYADLQEKYDYEKHELQTMIEQLREDVIELDKIRQLYIGKRKSVFLVYAFIS